MLLNVNFKHLFTISFDCACLSISRKQNKGDVDTLEDNSLKHRHSPIIFSQDKPSYLSYIKNCKIHTVHYNIGNKRYFNEVLVSRKRGNYSQSQNWVTFSCSAFTKRLWWAGPPQHTHSPSSTGQGEKIY